MDCIACDKVTKRYGERAVIRELSVRVPAGAIYGLLGPNGAGKTTLLRMVMGLTPVSAGRIRLFGSHPPGHTDARRRIGYMPQGLALYPNLSVRENIMFFGRMYGVAERALASRTDELIELVDLVSHAGASIATLSGGMARRAMLASTLVHAPELLILDEPTAGVDPGLRVRFWRWFEQLVRGGVSIIITTHHIAEARHAGRVLLLREGAILAEGSPGTLMERYGVADLEAAFVQATTRHGDNAEADRDARRRAAPPTPPEGGP